MTSEDYAEQVGDRLREAYNSKDRDAAFAAVADGDATIRASDLDAVARARFWRLVDESFHSGQLLVEKQESSALHALMRRIEGELARLAAEAEAGK